MSYSSSPAVRTQTSNVMADAWLCVDEHSLPKVGSNHNYYLPQKGGGYGHREHQRRHARRIRSRSNATLKSTIFPFLALPRELRDMIYDYAVDISEISDNIKKEEEAHFLKLKYLDQSNAVQYADHMSDLRFRFGQGSTPTIFLINKQILDEAYQFLHKRSLQFEAPAVCLEGVFPLRDMMPDGLIRNVRDLTFLIPMKMHTDATMLGELRYGNNWFEHNNTVSNESLEKAHFWGHFMLGCIRALYASGYCLKTITIGIKFKHGIAEYKINATESNVRSYPRMKSQC